MVTGFIIYVVINIIKRNLYVLAFISYAYLILGLVLFCYLLINQLKEVNGGKDSSSSRPKIFYDLHLDIVLLILILAGIVFRISSIVFIFLLTNKLIEIENFIKCNLCENILDVKNDSDNNLSEGEISKNSRKDGVINFINHSCEFNEKETEFLEKEKENMVILESPNSPIVNNILKKHEKKPSLVDYYKKIVK